MYIDKLDEIVDKCNSTYHRIIKMKPTDVKSFAYIENGDGHNEKDIKS